MTTLIEDGELSEIERISAMEIRAVFRNMVQCLLQANLEAHESLSLSLTDEVASALKKVAPISQFLINRVGTQNILTVKSENDMRNGLVLSGSTLLVSIMASLEGVK